MVTGRTRHIPLICFLTGLVTSLTGASLVLNFVFRRLPEMKELSSTQTTLRILLPHAILLVGLLLMASGVVYLMRQHVVRQREETSD